MALVLVTGATGRLGSAVVAELLERGNAVRAVVRPASKGKLPQRVQRFEHDLASGPLPQYAFDGVQQVVHLAGLVGDYSYERLYLQNAIGTKNLLSPCPSSVGKVVIASSISVYGEYRGQVVDEAFEPKAESQYGKSKLMAEKFATDYSDQLPIVLLRFGMVYGPRFEEGYYPVLRALERGKMQVLGDGKNRIPLVHITDVVQAIVLALGAKVQTGREYNIVGPDSLTQNELLEIAASELGVDAPKKHMSPIIAKTLARAKEALSSVGIGRRPPVTADNIRQMTLDRAYSGKRARDELGFGPMVRHREGIAEMVRIYKAEKQVE